MSRAGRVAGFTLVELMVALALGALLVGVSTPMAVRMYDTMQYRDAIRGLTAAASGARYRAVTSGRAMDLIVEPDAHRYAVQQAETPFDESQAARIGSGLEVEMVSARQLARPGLGVIRFYPDGTSTGGSVTLWRANGDGVRVRVDWLLGRVTQEAPEPL